MPQTTFVLVHGAWQAASIWDLVKPRLESAGHRVVTPALSGLEPDGQLLTASVDLGTHIEDVCRELETTDPGEVILVGHSYAGMIITGVAERTPHVSRLVYADAFIPEDRECVLDLLPAPIAAMFREQAANEGGGWRLPAGEGHLDLWGLKPGPPRDFIRARLSDFSIRCFEQKIRMTGVGAGIPRAFIAAVGDGYPTRSIFQRFGDKAKQKDWDYFELPTGHDSHVELPDQFAELLGQISRSPVTRSPRKVE